MAAAAVAAAVAAAAEAAAAVAQRWLLRRHGGTSPARSKSRLGCPQVRLLLVHGDDASSTERVWSVTSGPASGVIALEAGRSLSQSRGVRQLGRHVSCTDTDAQGVGGVAVGMVTARLFGVRIAQGLPHG